MQNVLLRLVTCAAVAALALACEESTTLPTTPSSLPAAKVGVLTIACPADQTARSLNGTNAPVVYPAPRVTGGQAPVTSSCTPPSGTTLPIATTPATCTASDDLGQTASCTFALRVLPAPRISATRFMAFGDSLTAGVTSLPVATALEVTKSYPFRLQQMLAARYPIQTVEVINAGVEGETATTGITRIPAQVDSVRPDVVLIMEGTNDAGRPDFNLDNTVASLDGLVAEALARGADAMIATVPPIRPDGAQARAAQELPVLNDAIRSIAFSRGVPLVDVFGAVARASCPTVVPTFGFQLDGRIALATTFPCIGIDNLHPTAAGYEVIAQAFFDEIVRQYDISVGGTRLSNPRSPLGPWGRQR